MKLLERPLGIFGIEAHRKIGAVIKFLVRSKLKANAAVLSVFYRLSRQEMLHECHIHFAEVRRQHHVPVTQLLRNSSPDASIHTIAEGLRVWVGIAQCAVFEGISSCDISSSFLIKIYPREAAIEVGAIFHGVVVKP